ncbi:MAG TPA: ClpXP protease specificity-enhancing factor SspB [Halothiobacillus sp.]|nr:ClpXP protease specificity-enhancing factor SspB [Halothiobacillus sp.]
MLSKRPYLVQALYEWTVDQGHVPIIVVDATVSRVMVPTAHVEEGKIHLNISPSAVRDFSIDRAAIAFEARFGGTPQSVFVPMRAILGIYDRDSGSGAQFPPEPDEEFMDDDDQPTVPGLSLAGTQPARSPTPIRSVPDLKPSAQADKKEQEGKDGNDGPDDEPPSPKGPKGSPLRIVK